jgi:hypothetical protein
VVALTPFSCVLTFGLPDEMLSLLNEAET